MCPATRRNLSTAGITETVDIYVTPATTTKKEIFPAYVLSASKRRSPDDGFPVGEGKTMFVALAPGRVIRYIAFVRHASSANTSPIVPGTRTGQGMDIIALLATRKTGGSPRKTRWPISSIEHPIIRLSSDFLYQYSGTGIGT